MRPSSPSAATGQPNYTASFSPSCIGTPASFRVLAVMIYKGLSTSSDIAPDTGFCCFVTQTLSSSSTSTSLSTSTVPGVTFTVPTTSLIGTLPTVGSVEEQQQQADGLQQQQQSAFANLFGGVTAVQPQQQQEQDGQQQQQQQVVPTVRPTAVVTAPPATPRVTPSLTFTGAAAATEVRVAVVLLVLGGGLVGVSRRTRRRSTGSRPRSSSR